MNPFPVLLEKKKTEAYALFFLSFDEQWRIHIASVDE